MNYHNQKSVVFFAGGQSAGPITPLIAVADQWSKQDGSVVPVFFDVRKSVASSLVPGKGFGYHNIIAAKFRRYMSLRTLFVPLVFIISFIQAIYFIRKYRPKLIVGAGGYVQIPLIIAGRLFGVKSIIHQQDVALTLSNVVCGPFAHKITTAFERSVRMFPQGNGFSQNYRDTDKVVWIGNPIMNSSLPSRDQAVATLGLKHDWPTVLITGGGTGAEGLNKGVLKALPELLKLAQVIHTTGRGKKLKFSHERYHQYEFLEDMPAAYAASDIVISRAGIGTIAELSEFSKCAVLVPMPNTHQVANAHWLSKSKAVLMLPQKEVAEHLPSVIRDLMHDSKVQEELSHNIHAVMPRGAANSFIEICKEATKHQK